MYDTEDDTEIVVAFVVSGNFSKKTLQIQKTILPLSVYFGIEDIQNTQ